MRVKGVGFRVLGVGFRYTITSRRWMLYGDCRRLVSSYQIVYKRVSHNSGYLFGVPIIRTIVFWGLYWVPLFWEITIRFQIWPEELPCNSHFFSACVRNRVAVPREIMAKPTCKTNLSHFIWVVVKIRVPFLDPYNNTAPNI